MSVSEDRDAVSIKVRDEGVGIQPDELPHLFNKYSKISSRPTNGEASTGLGLPSSNGSVRSSTGRSPVKARLGKGPFLRLVLKK